MVQVETISDREHISDGRIFWQDAESDRLAALCLILKVRFEIQESLSRLAQLLALGQYAVVERNVR